MTHNERQGNGGFTIVEMMLVMAVGITLVGIAMMSSGSALSSFKARGVLSKVQAQFVRARETAISEQRDVRIDFVGTNEIDLVRLDKPSGTTTLSKTSFEGGLIFTKVTGVPDTPDPWGSIPTDLTNPISFNPATVIQFRAGTGQLVDGTTLQPVSGRVFVGIANKPLTAGVVSVFGPTGRVRQYHWEGQWVF